MACGRYDIDVRQRAFWMQAFGTRVSPEQLVEMHPLRRIYMAQPDPAEVEEARQVDWDVFESGLASLNRERGK